MPTNRALLKYRGSLYREALTPQQKEQKKDYLLQQSMKSGIPAWDEVWEEIKKREGDWDAYIDREAEKLHPAYKTTMIGRIETGSIDFTDEEVEERMQKLNPMQWKGYQLEARKGNQAAAKRLYDQLYGHAYAQLSDEAHAEVAKLRPKAEAEVKQLAHQQYRRLVEHIKRLDGKPCWRAVMVARNLDITKVDNVGIFWAVDFDAAQPYFHGHPDWEHKRILILKGRIDIEYVDWKGTAGARFISVYGDRETEVRFLKHAPIFIDEVLVYDTPDSWYKTRKPTEVIPIHATRRA